MTEGRQEEHPTILFVDDDPGSAGRLQSLLDGRGFSIVLARSKQEALEAIASGRAHLMVVDIEKSHLEGREILTALRADEGRQHVPAIVLTTGGTAQQRGLGLRWGADDFIDKPIDPEEMAARIEVWLRIRHVQREALAKHRALSALYAIATS